MLALVDDWGNPSPSGAGTDWFGFAAIFLKKNQIQEMRNLYTAICQHLGRRSDVPFQSRKLSLENKYHITKLVTHRNPAISIIAVHIHDITSRKLQQRGWAYRYYAKEIIKSASHYAADYGEFAKVVFHRHEYLEDLENYIRDRLQYNSWYRNQSYSKRINYNTLVNVYSADDEEELLLCFADCIAHACHLALNPHPHWQQVIPVCLDLLPDRIWQGPSYDRNPRLFGMQLEPSGISYDLVSELPYTIRKFWE